MLELLRRRAYADNSIQNENLLLAVIKKVLSWIIFFPFKLIALITRHWLGITPIIIITGYFIWAGGSENIQLVPDTYLGGIFFLKKIDMAITNFFANNSIAQALYNYNTNLLYGTPTGIFARLTSDDISTIISGPVVFLTSLNVCFINGFLLFRPAEAILVIIFGFIMDLFKAQ